MAQVGGSGSGHGSRSAKSKEAGWDLADLDLDLDLDVGGGGGGRANPSSCIEAALRFAQIGNIQNRLSPPRSSLAARRQEATARFQIANLHRQTKPAKFLRLYLLLPSIGSPKQTSAVNLNGRQRERETWPLRSRSQCRPLVCIRSRSDLSEVKRQH